MKIVSSIAYKPRGMALLPVLIITGMITVVILLLFSLSNTLLRTSSAQSASYQTTALRDTAINMAIAQLRQGTTQTGALWISQPGALRTFVNNTGVASNIYKLYSNQNMVVPVTPSMTASQLNLENDVPSDAADLPDVYADLNLPSIDATGKIYFPIIDPRSQDVPFPTYPGSRTPEGFSYSDKQQISTTAIKGIFPPSSTDNSKRLAMHAQWIYLLADGSMGVIDRSSSHAFVPFSGQNNASATNPMVGRFAFWTDDESCKINVNTASEGIYWDTPRCATSQEIAFAKQPPVNMEVQRYGGHPATTCLSTVFYPGQRLLPSTYATELKTIYDMCPRVSYKDKNKAVTGAFLSAPAGPTAVNPVAMETPLKRLYASIDDFALTPARTEQPYFTANPWLLDKMRFFLTAESRAPEITASGHPKVSIWPIAFDSTAKTRSTIFDNLARFCTTLGNTPYHFRRLGVTSNIQEYYNQPAVNYTNAANDPMLIGPVCNANLAVYLTELAKLTKHGYAKSFAEKYDGRTGSPMTKPYNTATGLLDCLEYIRSTNLSDTTTAVNGSLVVPYVRVGWGNVGWLDRNWAGGTAGNLCAQDLNTYTSPLNATDTMLKNASTDGPVFTNGISREFTLSEFGLVLLVAAEYKPDGTQINSQLVTKLKLPKGYKAIQIAPLFEGFCPSQGFAGISPTSCARCGQLDTLRLLSAGRGLVNTGAAVTATVPTLTQAANTNWGKNLNACVPYLGNMTATKNSYQTADTYKSDAKWWVPWGGSGGRWMYEDNNSTALPTPTEWPVGVADFDDPSLVYTNDYSRGFFLIPSTEKTVTLKCSRAVAVPAVARCLELSVGNQRNGDFASTRILLEVPDMIIPVPDAPDPPQPGKPDMRVSYGVRLKNASANRYKNPEVLDPNDVVRTWVVRHGDFRLSHIRQNEGGAGFGSNTGFTDNNKRLFVPHPDWDPQGTKKDTTTRQIHSFTKSGGAPETLPSSPSNATFQRGLVKGITYGSNVQPDFTIEPDPAVDPKTRFKANVPANYPYSVDPSDTRDWDNGAGIAPDGAYWNKSDDVAKVWDGSIPPYLSNAVWDGSLAGAVNQTTAPNQLIPSAVMFGSIPSAASTGLQWTTYLFRPDITTGGHLGSKDNSTKGGMPGAPPDHVMLDWFWMPVVQPYAISEPFSTAGKVNMNYRIVPFTHINRSTAMHAVLKSEQILAIPTNKGSTYKNYPPVGNEVWRHYLDVGKTLLQWEEKFNNGQFFMNPGEVCEQFLVPENSGITATTGAFVRSQMANYWNDNKLTGDNTLERPYANIYPRLTTRSNTYRVHYLVQTITKARSTDPTKFATGKDTIIGEAQGDALVERAIDPNDPALIDPSNAQYQSYQYIKPNGNNTADFSGFSAKKSLDNLYIWRIRNIHRFSK